MATTPAAARLLSRGVDKDVNSYYAARASDWKLTHLEKTAGKGGFMFSPSETERRHQRQIGMSTGYCELNGSEMRRWRFGRRRHAEQKRSILK